MISRVGFIALIALTGAGLAAQAAINTRLRTFVGSPVLAVMISVGVSFLVMSAVAAFGAGGGMGTGFSRMIGAPWWIFAGGVLGAVFLLAMILAVSRVGVATAVTSAIAGQVVGSLFIDHFGLFGAERAPVTTPRLVGAGLLFMGVLLVSQKSA